MNPNKEMMRQILALTTRLQCFSSLQEVADILAMAVREEFLEKVSMRLWPWPPERDSLKVYINYSKEMMR